MAVNAGSIVTVAGRNVIDRLQSAGLGDVRTTFTTVREVGNYLVVDKVPEEPDFTFSMESWDVGTDMMAMLTGKVGSDPLASASAPGASDPAGTLYKWEDANYVNITSPWKAEGTSDKFAISAGHIIPGYFPTRVSYSFGVTDNASQTVELGGGSFFYAAGAPVEIFFTANGSTSAFTTTDPVIQHRKGGADGTTFLYVWGVLVNGVLQSEGVDYDVTGADSSTATVTFKAGHVPAAAAQVRFCHFTTAPKTYPQTVHAATVVKPGAVRGRNIKVFLDKGKPTQVRLGNLQQITLEATVDSEVERELGNEDVVGRTINGRDCTGTITARSRDAGSFLSLLSAVTGVPVDEVFGYLNLHPVSLDIEIENPKNPGQIIKTLYVADAIISPPGTPARVNSPTDFSLQWEAQSGTFAEVKGQRVA
jgi:hypothetical protein